MMSESTWNYRIVKRKRENEYQYELVEAYYTDGIMNGYTDDPAVFVGETAMGVVNGILQASAPQLYVVDENCQEIETIFGGRPKAKRRRRV